MRNKDLKVIGEKTEAPSDQGRSEIIQFIKEKLDTLSTSDLWEVFGFLDGYYGEEDNENE